jgi:hypothetical protein
LPENGVPELVDYFWPSRPYFPASATLIEKHQRQRKQEKGLHGEERGTWAVLDLWPSPVSAGG